MQRITEFKQNVGEKIFWTMVLGLCFHLIAVFFSEGFHRPDEHLGIMRFVGYKLGILAEGEALTSWEYPARIRPWLQPYLYYWFLIIPKSLGLENPFALAFLMRLFSSMLAFCAALKLYFNGVKFFKSETARLVLALGLFTLWFLPFFHARTSAENLSTTFFMFGLAFFISKVSSLTEKTVFEGTKGGLFLIGLLWGLSFICRYQTITLSLPILIWCFFRVSNKGQVLSFGTLGFLVAQALGLPIDYFGYGEWTFPPYNYFYENIINGKASQFGTDPFWYYLTKGISRGVPPVSLLILVSTFWVVIRKKWNFLAWSGLCFFIVHSLVAHKEVRFILPLAPLFAFYLAFFFEEFKEKFPKWLIYLLLFQNLITLGISSLKPAHNPIGMYKFLYGLKNQPEKIYTLNVVRDQLFFYQKGKIQMIHIKDISEIVEEESIVLTDRLFKARKLMINNKCETIYGPYPRFVEDLFVKYKKNKRMWVLLRCLR